jgi:hypothetical protein
MPRITFKHPDSYGKEIAPSTQKVYSGKLNKLATAGFDSVDKILEDPKKTIAALETLAPGDSEEAKLARRYFLSSIFWILPAEYTKKTNPFHKYYQKVLPKTVFGSDDKWVKRAKYTPEEESD